MNSIALIKDQSHKRIYDYLRKMDDFFCPKLSNVVDIKKYSKKISINAVNIFACNHGIDIGMVAFYINTLEKKVFITSISVLPEYQKKGVGFIFLEKIEQMAKKKEIFEIELEVNKKNIVGMDFYKKNKFFQSTEKYDSILLKKIIA